MANEEVEIDPGFRLYLHTALEPQYIREELAAITTVLRVDQSRDDTMEAMLDRFLVLEKPRLAEERLTLQKVAISIRYFPPTYNYFPPTHNGGGKS